jgi:hypothetical protein
MAARDRPRLPLGAEGARHAQVGGSPQRVQPTSTGSQAAQAKKTVALIVHHPTDPSAFDTSSITRNTVRGGGSAPPSARGRYHWNRPAAARATARAGGTRRVVSPSSRAARMRGPSAVAATKTASAMGVPPLDAALPRRRTAIPCALAVTQGTREPRNLWWCRCAHAPPHHSTGEGHLWTSR